MVFETKKECGETEESKKGFWEELIAELNVTVGPGVNLEEELGI